jgi:hypothetical protein
MRKRTVLALAVALLALAALPRAGSQAQTRLTGNLDASPYFPLQVGNEWIYQKTTVGGVERWRAAVTDRVLAANGRLYFALEGYFGPRRLVRATARGAVTEFNPGGNGDHLWYLLGSPVGTTWEIDLQPLPLANPVAECIDGSKLLLASRTDSVEVPAGAFRNVIRVDFRPPCVDAGIVTEWFAPGVGLVKRIEDSFAGPVVSELVHANVGEQALPRLPYSTSLALDRPAYVNSLMPPIGPGSIPTVRGLFVLRNLTDLPIDFSFSGCKSVSVAVVDAAGEALIKASGNDGGCCACDNVFSFRLVNDALVLPVSFRLETPDGQPLPDGRYAVVATLDALDRPPLRPSATATIDVRSTH